MEATEGARILSVQDRVHAVLVERRVPLLDGVGRVRARKKRPRGHEEADEDRSPRGGADRSLRAADGNAYADGLAQGNSPQRETAVTAVEEAQCPRGGAADGAQAEDRQGGGGFPLNVEGRVGH